MNILGTQYSIATKSFDIFVSGCKAPHCKGCFNPETWEFKRGDLYSTQMFIKWRSKIKTNSLLAKNIFVMGGEPLDQDTDSLVEMLFELNSLNIPIWLFTHYDLNEVPLCVQQYCSYIKCGRYMPELKHEHMIYGVRLATDNQRIYKKGVHF